MAEKEKEEEEDLSPTHIYGEVMISPSKDCNDDDHIDLDVDMARQAEMAEQQQQQQQQEQEQEAGSGAGGNDGAGSVDLASPASVRAFHASGRCFAAYLAFYGFPPSAALRSILDAHRQQQQQQQQQQQSAVVARRAPSIARMARAMPKSTPIDVLMAVQRELTTASRATST